MPFGIWFQAFISLIIFLGLPIYIYLWIDYNRTTFVVEDNKITLNWGIIEKYSKSVAFNNVQNITNARGILSQFLGLSKVNIWTSSPSQIEIRGKESENRPELFLQLEYSDGEWLKNFILDKRSK